MANDDHKIKVVVRHFEFKQAFARTHHQTRYPYSGSSEPMSAKPLDLRRLKVFPLDQRKSLTRVEDILMNPDAHPAPVGDEQASAIARCAADIKAARQ